ncbi:SDR family NAD(P)-dependent oxidoreductase [Sphingomonas sp. H39-1-10]|uniref:SDR family NAD(P)-dependent oxidoreductase n=1 Tax=Sphingomonas TaxID=13687 RepID=UPI00087F9225|nr:MULTISPECIES: SDR family oxidoreductase [Sphingomonas]MDF0489746.1 SDR family NAD(P)-dependent oxidoreductase [Sphingomonas pollutisoli]SDA31331.1 NAD(P)-dependent dehydrogenase, short-chain alcohol dehydrogenase family [Sphingomonas sp. NFR15]
MSIALLPAEDRAVYPSLKGKRVLVTGGATGIGAGLVEAFARAGARVAFLDINAEAGVAHAARFEGAVFKPCDLRDLALLKTTIESIIAEFGGIDVLINNAASDDRHTIDAITPEYWDERMATNLRHLLFAAQAVVPGMRANGGGVILNFGSISWHLGLPELMLYETAKAGIEGMTRAMARDFGRDNIRVSTIVPGNVQTPRQEKWYTPEGEAEIVAAQCLDGRIQPADVAALALFLASDDARMCTGHDYFIDAGWR